MLTRRQARLLGLTTSGEERTASPSTAVLSSRSFAPSVRDAVPSPDAVRGVAVATPSQNRVGGTAASLHVGASARAGRVDALWTSSSALIRAPLAVGVHGGCAGRRAETRLVEALRTKAQAAMECCTAASSTAGPLIQLAGEATVSVRRRPSLSSYGRLSRRNTVLDGNDETAWDGARYNDRATRLSVTQLRARWRHVMRSCSTTHAHARPSGANSVDGASARVSGTSDSKMSSNGAHVLRLSSDAPAAAASAAPLHPPTRSLGLLTQPLSHSGEDPPTLHPHGVRHGDTPQAEAASELETPHRSLLAFTPPFYVDAPPRRAFISFPTRSVPPATSDGPAAALPMHPLPITALALRRRKEAVREQRERCLNHEVHYQFYVKAHEARMRLLFGCPEDDENMGAETSAARLESTSKESGKTADEVEDCITAGEEAYLRALDPERSEEEARVMHVIQAIDAALQQQLSSAYAHPAPSKNSHQPIQHEEGASSSVSTIPVDPASPLSPPRPSPSEANAKGGCSAIDSFIVRRPAILEAAIAEATQRVEAFAAQLLPYQQEGVRWLLRINVMEHMNGILADDMGLGKTAQTVVYLACYKDMVEEVVQAPLESMHHQYRQLCQQALRGEVAAGAGESSSGGSIVKGAVPWKPKARIGNHRPLPPWLRWFAAMLEEADAVNDGTEGVACSTGWMHLQDSGPHAADTIIGKTRGASDARRSTPAYLGANAMTAPAVPPPLAEVRTLERLIRMVEWVKQWMWQLGGDAADADSSVACRANDMAVSVALLGRKRQRGGVGGNCAEALTDFLPSTPEVAAPPGKRRRGRPPKHHVEKAAVVTAAAAAAAATPSWAPEHSDAQSSSPEQAAIPLHIRQGPATTTTTATAALGHRRGTEHRTFRPVLIIAPLSTLPHWADEFKRFGCRDIDGGDVWTATRAAQAAAAPIPLGNGSSAGSDPSQRFSVYVLNGSRQERESRMSDFLQLVEKRQELREEGQTAAGMPTSTPVLAIPHDLLTKPLSGALRRIRRVAWHVVVIDEAQRIKSSRSTLFQKVCELQTISRLVLTGTPLQNNTTELFSLLRFLAPHSFTSSTLFEQLDSALLAASRSSALEDRELHILLCRRVHRLLAPFILRREKTVLKTALPPLRDFAVLCPLLPFQEAQLKEVEEKRQAGALSGSPHILYRKILLHPYTTQPFFYVDEEVVRTSGKLLVLDFMMRFLQRTQHKFLVFCGWTLMLDVVETLCGMRNIPYVRLDGKTPVEQREANIRGFNQPLDGRKGEADEEGLPGRRRRRPLNRCADDHHNDEDDEEDRSSLCAPCCFLISKVAGGVGLNLQAADTVFLLDVDYNPQRDAQALSRVYRVGQTKEVRVLRLVIDHPIERDIVAIHEAKENLSRAVVQAGRYDLHSSVHEREAALQHLFQRGALSQLSQQWTLTSPTGRSLSSGQCSDGERPVWAATRTAGEEEAEGDLWSPSSPSLTTLFPLPTVLHKVALVGDGEAPSSPLRTPTDLHRVFLRGDAPISAACEEPLEKEHKELDSKHGEEAAAQTSDRQSAKAHPVQTSSNSTSSSFARTESVEGVGGVSSTQGSAPQRRRRRYISFKLDGQDGEEDTTAQQLQHNGATNARVGENAASPAGVPAFVPFDTVSPSLGKEVTESRREDALPHTCMPQEHLLAMRSRLEEVLLRHEGERRVMEDMFHSLEDSLRREPR